MPTVIGICIKKSRIAKLMAFSYVGIYEPDELPTAPSRDIKQTTNNTYCTTIKTTCQAFHSHLSQKNKKKSKIEKKTNRKKPTQIVYEAKSKNIQKKRKKHLPHQKRSADLLAKANKSNQSKCPFHLQVYIISKIH